MNTPGVSRAALGFALTSCTLWGVITGMTQKITNGAKEHEQLFD